MRRLAPSRPAAFIRRATRFRPIQESTKQEIDGLREEMGELRRELRQEIGGVEQRLNSRIDTINKNVQEGIGPL